MHKPLLGEKLAVLVTSGFFEQDLVQAQKAAQTLGVMIRIVSMDHGLVNSWNGESWGLNFAVDTALSAALSSDFSMILIPGGQRSVEKLKLTAHTRRFIQGFIQTGKPVIAANDALELLIFTDSLKGQKVSGPESLKKQTQDAGSVWSDMATTIDGSLMTGAASEQEVLNFLTKSYALVEAA